MTELQMGLIGLGGAAVVGVLAYNKWQEHKHRKVAEQVLNARHADVLLSEPPPVETGTEAAFVETAVDEAPTMPAIDVPIVAERIEPSLRLDPRLDPRIDPDFEEPATPQEALLAEPPGGVRERFPALATPRKEDICYATQNRQDAVKQLVAQCDVIVVVGSRSSSNSNRLREIATTRGIPGYLVDGADDLRREWFEGKQAVGVTAGASAPETLVQQVVARLREWGGMEAVEVIGREENVVFGLPQAMRQLTRSRSA